MLRDQLKDAVVYLLNDRIEQHDTAKRAYFFAGVGVVALAIIFREVIDLPFRAGMMILAVSSFILAIEHRRRRMKFRQRREELESRSEPSRSWKDVAWLMSVYSEERYAAGWLIDLEYQLWEEILGISECPGFDSYSIDRLKEYVRTSGHWVVHLGAEGRAPVPVQDWYALYGLWHILTI